MRGSPSRRFVERSRSHENGGRRSWAALARSALTAAGGKMLRNGGDMAFEQHATKLRTAFALHESGVALKRAQLRRQHAGASDEQLAQLLAAWLQERPGAEYGDSVGQLREHPKAAR